MGRYLSLSHWDTMFTFYFYRELSQLMSYAVASKPFCTTACAAARWRSYNTVDCTVGVWCVFANMVSTAASQSAVLVILASAKDYGMGCLVCLILRVLLLPCRLHLAETC